MLNNDNMSPQIITFYESIEKHFFPMNCVSFCLSNCCLQSSPVSSYGP